MERLSAERFPAVFCRIKDWRRIAQSMADLDPTPLVLALSREDRKKKDWIEAIAHNAYSLNVKRLAATKVFPLLNHAWRTFNDAS